MVNSCELSKEVDVNFIDFPPKLSVTAILDSDSLVISISEGRSLAMYTGWQPKSETILREGIIELFEEEKLIYSVSELFDLSMRSDTVSGYHAVHKGFPLTRPGFTYRLSINIEGYETISSKAVMPSEVIVNNVQIDTTTTERKQNILDVWSLSDDTDLGIAGSGTNFYPITLQLTDIPNEKNYYSFQLFFQSSAIEVKGGSSEEREDLFNLLQTRTTPFIYTDNVDMIRDNPDFEMRLLNINKNPYSFLGIDFLLISDATLSNKTSVLKFYVDTTMVYNRIFNTYKFKKLFIEKNRRTDFEPNSNNLEIHMKSKLSLIVKHVGNDTYKNYRSISLQQQGIGLFKEPTPIYSNIINGFGFFSLCSSSYIELLDFDAYIYAMDRNFN